MDFVSHFPTEANKNMNNNRKLYFLEKKKCSNFRFDILDWDNLFFNLTLCQSTGHKFYPVITNQDPGYQ